MSVIIHLMGRVTKDPVMQQGRNNGTEYISLDLATSQRSQNAQNNPDNPYESVFYQCYLNKHLAERLSKAGVKKGTCLYIYEDLELHPFVYSQGQRAGQAGSGAKINVRDWQFCLSNKSEGDAGGNQAGAPPYNGGAATPGAGGYPNPGPQNGGYQNPAGAAQGGAYPANGNAAGNGNYPVIAGIAIAGITGSLLFLLIPMLPRVSVPAFLRDTHSHIQKRGKNRQKSPVFDMETLLIRQISYQITDKIKATFPDASWEYTRPIKAESLLNCELIRIRTFHTGDYNFADISLDRYGHLKLFMMTITDFTPSPGRTNSDNPMPGNPENPAEPPVHVDPESWYSLIGKPLLTELIGDLQARGHQKLFINEAGEIFIYTNNTPEIKDTFQHFPPRDYWAALMDIFTRDELKAAETNDTLEVSWA